MRHDDFLGRARQLYAGVHSASIRVVEDASVAVPGFVALEVKGPGLVVRGWASGADVVMARRHNLAPVLEALGFRDRERLVPLDALVARLVWLHGPPYTLVTRIAKGEHGAPRDYDLTPRREMRHDGLTTLSLALLDPGGDGFPTCVYQHLIIARPSGAYVVRIDQVLPASDRTPSLRHVLRRD